MVQDAMRLQDAMRSRFKQITVPAGLREQILSERKAFTRSFPRLVRWAPVAVCAAILLAGMAYINFRTPSIDRLASFRQSNEPHRVTRVSKMDLETSDLNKIHQYLRQNQLLSTSSRRTFRKQQEPVARFSIGVIRPASTGKSR